MIGIYSIRNKINDKFYIGSSIDIDYRWHKQHVKDLSNNIHENIHLQRAWNKYGSESFELIILEECSSSKLLDTEQKYLDKFWNSGNLYNISKCVRAPFRGRNHSIESKISISEKLKGRKFTSKHKKNLSISASKRRGIIPWNKGKTYHSEKMSITRSTRLWRFIDPNGKLYEFYNLTKFCKNNNLSQSAMNAVANGKLKQNNGWRAII